MDHEGKTWRILTNVWTVVALGLFTVDFATNNRFDSSVGAVGVIYIAVLGIFVGTKEFERWHAHHSANYFGEIYIIIWSTFVLVTSITAVFSGQFQIPSELVIVYTVVLSIFAVSRRSKALYSRRRQTPDPLANIKKYVKVRKQKAKKKKI